jgi:hypothetical protein
MKRESKVKTKIKEILGINRCRCYIDRTSFSKDKKKNNHYRMKLMLNPGNVVTAMQIAQIEKLPHVYRVTNINAFWGEVRIYFDCKPSEIEL